MCKQLAQHGKQSCPSTIAAIRLGSFSFIQKDYDALVPFLRNHFLFPDPSDYFLDVLWIDNTLLVPCLP